LKSANEVNGDVSSKPPIREFMLSFIFIDFVLELEMQVVHIGDIIAEGFVLPLLTFTSIVENARSISFVNE